MLKVFMEKLKKVKNHNNYYNIHVDCMIKVN